MQTRTVGFPLLAGAALAMLMATTLHAAVPSIGVVQDAQGRVVAVEANQIVPGCDLSVAVVNEGGAADDPTIVGAQASEGDRLRFTPKYGFRPGVPYRAVLRLPARGEKAAVEIRYDFHLPDAPAQAAPHVTAVYPSGDTLPENQLKFYVHFSAPMSRGEAYEHVQLLADDGQPVDLPFLEIGEELWDRTGQRLTLLIDPGRIKRGVKPREDIGPVLEEGRKYTLVIGAGYRSAQGAPTKVAHEKSFRAGPPTTEALQTNDWRIAAPLTGSRKPLAVQFPQPLDHALLQRTFAVVRKNGEQIDGQVEIEDNERRWTFQPAKPWQAGEHEIVIDTVLEDLAGNRIGSAFEVDALDPLQKRIDVETARMPFRIEK